MNKIHILLFLTVFALPACTNSNSNNGEDSAIDGPWLIPENEVRDGGPGKDGIPALTRPSFIETAAATLPDDALVIGVKVGDDIRAYPHNILNWHEIVNDVIDGRWLTVNFCPLTGSAMAWKAPSKFGDKTFGVSGLLYNSNLILYDRETDSNWSQMLIQSVNGDEIGTEAELSPVVETEWGTWKQMYPDTVLMSTNTGHVRNYGVSPYGDYVTNNNLLFPAANSIDRRLHIKARVLGIQQGNLNKAYPVAEFASDIQVLNENIGGESVVVIGSSGFNFAIAFDRQAGDGIILEFTPIQGVLPIVMQDGEGNQWDIFGVAVSGPRMGERLPPARSFIAYWFAWTAFYPDSTIHEFN